MIFKNKVKKVHWIKNSLIHKNIMIQFNNEFHKIKKWIIFNRNKIMNKVNNLLRKILFKNQLVKFKLLID